MRIAELAVPRAPDDTEDAEVVIFYFGGSGGSVDGLAFAIIVRGAATAEGLEGRARVDTGARAAFSAP